MPTLILATEPLITEMPLFACETESLTLVVTIDSQTAVA